MSDCAPSAVSRVRTRLIRVFPVVFQKEAGTAAPVLTLKQHDDDHDHVELADVIKKKNDTLFHYTTNK